jgi:AGCS family alanine or glycine:cation symporter
MEVITDRYVFEHEEELTPLSDPVPVLDGKVEGILFQYNDALIDDSLILEGGAPYTGPLGLRDRDLIGEGGEIITLDIQGKAIQTGAVLTGFAFEEGFGGAGLFGRLIVTLSVFLFGLSTIISWSYYGDRCVVYLFGVRYVFLYRCCYVGFTCLGAVLALEVVWAYGDLAMGLMTVPNLIAVLLLSPVIVKITKDYVARHGEKIG